MNIFFAFGFCFLTRRSLPVHPRNSHSPPPIEIAATLS